MKHFFSLFALATILTAAPALAMPVAIDLPEPQFTLKPGPGLDAVMNNCQTCHSLDYVSTQPPHMGDAFWDSEVQKMIKTFGAPISGEDATAIASYLKKNY